MVAAECLATAALDSATATAVVPVALDQAHVHASLLLALITRIIGNCGRIRVLVDNDDLRWWHVYLLQTRLALAHFDLCGIEHPIF